MANHIYSRLLDPQSSDSLAKIVAFIPEYSTVLDIGTGTGQLGLYLATDKSCIVDGVDRSEEQLSIIAGGYRKLIAADVENDNWMQSLPTGAYDFVVLADVLEHLQSPERLLAQISPLLRPTGRCLISVPNIGYWGLLAELCLGRFEYRQEGLLDETHVRFFTRKSLLSMLQQSGFQPTFLDFVDRSLIESEFLRDEGDDCLDPGLLKRLESIPDAGVYQFIVAANYVEGGGVDLTEFLSLDSGFRVSRQFRTQLYWRELDGQYHESASHIERASIGCRDQVLDFRLPEIQIGGLRLDLSDRPGYLHLQDISLRTCDGSLIWCWSGDIAELEVVSRQEIEFAHSNDNNVVAIVTGYDPFVELPIPQYCLAKAGLGTLSVRMGWPESSDYMAVASRFLEPESISRMYLSAKAMLGVQSDEIAMLRQRDETARHEIRRLNDADLLRAETIGTQTKLISLQEQTIQAQTQLVSTLRVQLDDAGQRLSAALRGAAEMQQNYENVCSELDIVRRSRLLRIGQRFRRTFGLPTINASPVSRDGETDQSKRPMLSSIEQGKGVVPDGLVVDVIVPVYRGLLDTRNCLESVLAAPAGIEFRIIAIDDCSPEPEVSAYLDELAELGRITLLRNEINLGFVQTVNRGMELSGDNDVLLLNSDTVVANDWLARIQSCAYADKNIGTVTPFSNNATICSYPNFCTDNTLDSLLNLADLDLLFARINSGLYLDIPTAVGFCMYIRRDCLRNVGLFDAEHFGKGYGEENDFSVRAATAGWRNVLCADTYVLHVGSVSFQADKKPGVQRAMQTLRKLHPDYEPAVLQFVSQDPIRPLRLAIDLARLAERRLPRILVVTHDRLGGTQKHIDDLAELFTSEIDFLLLRPAPNGSVTLSWLRKDEPLCLTFNVDKNFEQLLQVLRMIGISRVHFHHLLAQHPRIWGIATDLDVEYDFSVHDYYSMCPQISLTGRDNKYCGEKGVSDCGRCLADQPAPGDVDIQTWRSNYERLLHHASKVFAPSAYVADRIRRYFPEARVHAVPHPETDKVLRAAPPTPRVSTVGRALKIGVLGALSPVKGPDLLEACAIDAKRRGLPLQFDLFGYAYRHLLSAPKSALTVYGQYEPDQLQALFDHYQPDLIWFPAQWPETYSYTLSEAIASSMPVVCPDIGAFPERIVGREWSWVCEWDKDAKQINDFFMRIKTEHFDRNSPPSPYAAQFELPSFEYRRDYLKSCSAPASKIFDAAGVHGFVAEYRATHATMVTAIATPVRLKALAILVKLRGAPVMRWVSRSMPMAWQRKVKNLLLGHRN